VHALAHGRSRGDSRGEAHGAAGAARVGSRRRGSWIARRAVRSRTAPRVAVRGAAVVRERIAALTERALRDLMYV